jgi:hypothetical protein
MKVNVRASKKETCKSEDLYPLSYSNNYCLRIGMYRFIHKKERLSILDGTNIDQTATLAPIKTSSPIIHTSFIQVLSRCAAAEKLHLFPCDKCLTAGPSYCIPLCIPPLRLWCTTRLWDNEVNVAHSMFKRL